jgi:hypothetical protein
MRIDITDLLRVHARAGHRQADSSRPARSILSRRGDMKSIRRGSISGQLRQDFGPALAGVVFALQHQHSRPLPHHQAIPVQIERLGSNRIIIPP